MQFAKNMLFFTMDLQGLSLSKSARMAEHEVQNVTISEPQPELEVWSMLGPQNGSKQKSTLNVSRLTRSLGFPWWPLGVPASQNNRFGILELPFGEFKMTDLGPPND